MEPVERQDDALADARPAHLTADYDRRADVLYVRVGDARPAEVEERPDGVLLRFALDDDAPCGVTVMGLHKNRWFEHRADLARSVASFLGEPEDVAARAIADALNG